MFFVRVLALVLVPLYGFAFDGSSIGLLALCSQSKSCLLSSNEYVKNLVSTCNMQMKALDCDGLAQKNPEMKSLLKHCDFQSQCKEQEEYEKSKELACLRGYKNALVDTGIALKDLTVSLGSFIESSWDHFKTSVKQRNEFIRQCNKSIACKRDLVKEDHRYNTMSDDQLNKYTAAYLYVQAQDMKAYQASLDRAPGRPRATPPSNNRLTPVQETMLSDLMNMVGDKIGQEYQKFSCYSGLAKVEMACYVIGNVVDPTLLAGAAFKGARLVAATGRAIAAEEAIRATDEVRAVGKLYRGSIMTREALVKDFLTYSPTTVTENEKWIAIAEKGVNSKVRFLDVENSQLKGLNDTLKDKNLVTSLTNYHKKLLFDKIEELKKQFPDLVIDQYSDFKSSRFAFSGKIPKDLDQRLQQIFKETNQEFAQFLKLQKVVRDGDASTDWFRAGVGQSAEQANVAARYSRSQADNIVQSYAQENLSGDLTSKLMNVEKSRQNLRTSLNGTSVLEGNTLNSDAFDIVRKNMGNDDKIAAALKDRFALTNIPSSTVKELQTYVKSTDEFSPGIFVPQREVAHLNDAVQGGFSADVIGLGASNIKGTAEALSKSSNLDQALIETRKAEKSVTVEFKAQKKFFEDTVTKAVDPGKIRTVCSGDDCVAIAVKPLNDTDKKKILTALADSKYSGKFRLAFVPDGVTDIATRNVLSTHGESVEKLLRASLSSVMEPRKLQGLTFGLDMRTQVLNDGTVKLLIGEAPGVKLSVQERALIQKKFEESLRSFNQSFTSKGTPSNYSP